MRTHTIFLCTEILRNISFYPQLILINHGYTMVNEVNKMDTIKRDRMIGISICLLVIMIMVAITFQVGQPLVELASDPVQLNIWLQEQGIFSRIMMIAIVFLQIVIAFIPGEVFEIAAGYAFGFWEGTFLCLVGSMIASGFVMLLVRRFKMRIISIFFTKEKIDEISFLKDTKRLKLIVFIAFFIPGSPKDIMTYMIGLTNMKVSTFMMISTVARIPSVITSTFSGSALGSENMVLAICSFVFTIIISILGLWYYTYYMNKQKKVINAVQQ